MITTQKYIRPIGLERVQGSESFSKKTAGLLSVWIFPTGNAAQKEFSLD